MSISISKSSSFFWCLKQSDDKKDKEEEHKKVVEARKKAKEAKKKKLLEVEEDDEKKEEKEILVKDMLCLRNITLKVNKGEFICVIGDVGAGKSSLLAAILGELHCLDQQFVRSYGDDKLSEFGLAKMIEEKSATEWTEAPVKIFDTISYVQQTPWIQNKTIKENILFGSEFDAEKYKQTIKLCELTRDLEILPAGDETEIGEKGINLSGG